MSGFSPTYARSYTFTLHPARAISFKRDSPVLEEFLFLISTLFMIRSSALNKSACYT